jgi:hypothetical protein
LINKILILTLKSFFGLLIFIILFLLVRSSLDIYNTFAYDKAIVKESPYGYVPLLQNPADWQSGNEEVFSGQFVYVEDWVNAYNNRITFAKVKKRLNGGYINKDLLVEAKLDIKPVISVVLLTIILSFITVRLFRKFYYRI